jgi:AcrR family transcriptional regulator
MTPTASTSARTRPPRRRQGEVVEAAAVVFHEKGYESTSIQDIADAVGILKGSLYYYIRSKEDLLFEVIQGVHEDAFANVKRMDGMDGDALQKIRAFVTLHVTFNAHNLTKMGVFFHDFRSLSAERRKAIVAARDLYDARLRGLIVEGQKASLICPDIDPKVASMSIMGQLNWIYQWYKPRGPSSVAVIAEEFANLVVAGLYCTPETHEPGHRSRLGALPRDVVE